MTWQQIAEKHGTDKATHGYMPFYEKYMPKQPTRILEIGCLTGASLRMWREIYPETEIHCLDLFEEHQPPTDISGVIYWKGNQTDQFILEQLRRINFDVVIEDGSHLSLHQLISLYSLISCTKYYFVEDLHSNTEDFYREGLPYKSTLLGQIEHGIIPFPTVIDAQHKIALITK